MNVNGSALLSVRGQFASEVPWSKPVKDGRVTFDRVALDQEYEIRLLQGEIRAVANFRGPDARGTTKTVALTIGGWVNLSGRLVRSSGNPLVNTDYFVRCIQGETVTWCKSARTNQSGDFSVSAPRERLCAGTLHILVDKPVALKASTEFGESVESRTDFGDVLLGRLPVYASGVIRDVNGRAVPGAHARVTTQSGDIVLCRDGASVTLYGTDPKQTSVTYGAPGFAPGTAVMSKADPLGRTLTLRKACDYGIDVYLDPDVPPEAVGYWLQETDRGKRRTVRPSRESVSRQDQTTVVHISWDRLEEGVYDLHVAALKPPTQLATRQNLVIRPRAEPLLVDLRGLVVSLDLRITRGDGRAPPTTTAYVFNPGKVFSADWLEGCKVACSDTVYVRHDSSKLVVLHPALRVATVSLSHQSDRGTLEARLLPARTVEFQLGSETASTGVSWRLHAEMGKLSPHRRCRLWQKSNQIVKTQITRLGQLAGFQSNLKHARAELTLPGTYRVDCLDVRNASTIFGSKSFTLDGDSPPRISITLNAIGIAK